MARIVVVEDSKLMQTLLRRMLERAGHEVDLWEDITAMEVGGRITETPPDLLITDYSMPGCNGLTVAKMARKAKPDLPVVVVTATHDPAVLEALTKQEVTCILHKPLQEAELLAALAEAMAAGAEGSKAEPEGSGSDPV
jgi:CheY-like chemotaxis protein